MPGDALEPRLRNLNGNPKIYGIITVPNSLVSLSALKSFTSFNKAYEAHFFLLVMSGRLIVENLKLVTRVIIITRESIAFQARIAQLVEHCTYEDI